MADHAFVADPHGRDVCDRKVSDGGRPRLCGLRQAVRETPPQAEQPPREPEADDAERAGGDHA